MPPVVLLKTSVDIGALDTPLEVGSNSSPAITQYVKIQRALQESIQRAAQTFRAAPALKEFSAARATANMQHLMGPVAALKEQIAAAQAHIAPLIVSRWKGDQERAQRLADTFRPLIDARWKEAQERLQPRGAPLKALQACIREASQPFRPEGVWGQAKLPERATSLPVWMPRPQPLPAWMASEAFQEQWQRSGDIVTMVDACCPLFRESSPENQQEDRINAAVTRLIAHLHPGLRNPRAAQALRQKAKAQHTSPQNFLCTEVFPTAIRLVASEVTSPQRMRVGREWVTNTHGKILVASPWETSLRVPDFHHWFFSQVYVAAAAIVLDDVYPRPITQQVQVLVYKEDALERLTVPASVGARDSAMLAALLQAEEMDPADQLHRMLTVASPRARELFRLLSQGLSIKEAAAVLGISPATAYVHCYRTRAKGHRRKKKFEPV